MPRGSHIVDWLERFGIAALLVAAVFLALPQIDPLASSLFGTVGGFPIRRVPALIAVRDALIGLTDGGMLVVLAAMIAGLTWPSCRVVRTRILAFALACYALGPGLLVNGVLKSHSGRARPWNVDLFGGDALFTPVLHPADQCRIHCSFVSGEASTLATIATILFLVAVPLLPTRRRLPASLAIAALATGGSLLRVAFGAHFLSDVVFAWIICVPLVLALYLAFGLHRLDGILAPDSDHATGADTGNVSRTTSPGPASPSVSAAPCSAAVAATSDRPSPLPSVVRLRSSR